MTAVRYSVAGLDPVTRTARRASAACIRDIVRAAADEKARALAKLTDPAWMARASLMSQEWAREAGESSLHALSRRRLEYLRYRAFLAVGSHDAGSYAPVGWPVDRLARDRWISLN